MPLVKVTTFVLFIYLYYIIYILNLNLLQVVIPIEFKSVLRDLGVLQLLAQPQDCSFPEHFKAPSCVKGLLVGSLDF